MRNSPHSSLLKRMSQSYRAAPRAGPAKTQNSTLSPSSPFPSSTTPSSTIPSSSSLPTTSQQDAGPSTVKRGHDFEIAISLLLPPLLDLTSVVVQVGGRGDGGRDLVSRWCGRGLVVQCKAWKRHVQPMHVRDFEGTLVKQGQRGVLADQSPSPFSTTIGILASKSPLTKEARRVIHSSSLLLMGLVVNDVALNDGELDVQDVICSLPLQRVMNDRGWTVGKSIIGTVVLSNEKRNQSDLAVQC